MEIADLVLDFKTHGAFVRRAEDADASLVDHIVTQGRRVCLFTAAVEEESGLAVV